MKTAETVARVAASLVVAIALIGCNGAGAGGGGAGEPDTGLDVSFTMSTGAVGGLSTAAHSTASGVAVSQIAFRGSDLSFYSIDETSLPWDDFAAMRSTIKETEVQMRLPDVPDTFTFSNSGDSVLPIDEVGDFRNRKYNLININIGAGMFYYLTNQAGHYYPLQAEDGNTYNIMGTDRVKVGNILLVDNDLWQALGESGVRVWENADVFMTDSEPFVVQGANEFDNEATNQLIMLLSNHKNDFDVDGAIVYPMDGPVDLTPFTELEGGYHSIDADSVDIDIRISMQWDMPTSAGYTILFDPADLDPGDAIAYSSYTINDVFARRFFRDVTITYDGLQSEEDFSDPDSRAREVYDTLPTAQGLAMKSQFNRYISRSTSDIETYDFSVGVQVTRN